MKGIYITLIMIMSILALALLGILGFAIYNGGEVISFGGLERIEKNIQKEEKFSIENIQNLNIDFASPDTYIYTTDDSEIRVIQYANRELKQDHLFQVSSADKILSIQDHKKIHFGFFINPRTIYEIFIPKTYCEKINIKTVSGDIHIENDICGSITLESTSGDIKSDHVLENVDGVATVSGDIDLDIVKSDLKINTTSGDITVNTIVGSTYMHTISGEVSLYSLKGDSDIETTSGDVKIDHFEIQNDSKIKTVSGDVDLALENSNCEVRTKTVSGDVQLPNGSSLIGNGSGYIFDIKTTSGDIHIR